MDKHENAQHDAEREALERDRSKRDAIKPTGANGPETRPYVAPEKAPEGEPPISARDWWVQNGASLAFIAAIIAFLAMMDVSLTLAAKVAIGLGLVIFLHELGHFLAAKWCDVHVTTFSIGFGPAIPGASYKWGETTYKLALFPLGGYVQMVGQVDGDESSDGSEEDPRSYKNKPVGQRMLIISAGVIMNVILAIVCFVVVFRGPGKDRIAGVIDAVDSGPPAFTAGLRSGAEVLQVGNVTNPYFENLKVRVMAAMHGEKVTFITKVPGQAEPQVQEIQPRKGAHDKTFVIGLGLPESAQLRPRRYLAPIFKGPFLPDSAAAKASPGFDFGDNVVATTDPDDPTKIKDLPDDPRLPNQGRKDFFELSRRMQQLAGQDIVLIVERGDEKHVTKVPVTLPPTFHQTLGVRMEMGQITAIRDHSPAAKAGVLTARKNDEGGLVSGDLIQKVVVTGPDESVTIYDESNLDPERLPFQLQQWAKRLAEKNVPKPAPVEGAENEAAEHGVGKPNPWIVELTVTRHKLLGEAATVTEPKTLQLLWDDSWRYDRIVPFVLSSPQAIPELGLAYQIKTIVADVIPGLVKDNPLRTGDAIREIRPYYRDVDASDKKPTALQEDAAQWAHVAYILQSPGLDKVALKVWRNQKMEEVTAYPVADKTWPAPDTGLVFMTDTRRQIAATTLEAIGLGFSDTWDNMKQVFQNLRGMIFGTIAIDQLGGPITIASAAYKIAAMDFWEFVFFLGMISVNLAVINFLPIPVLDGGHMVFLLYEKVRGKPASEGIRVGATYAGLALILCLMVFVIYLDIMRLI